MTEKTVLITDDSAVVRGLISNMLSELDGVTVIGSAANGQMAIDMYKRLTPDIMIMDIEMPVKDGMTALKEILDHDPQAQIVMCSTLSQKNAETSLKALQIGAIEYIAKPSTSSEVNSSEEFRNTLKRVVKAIPPRRAQDTSYKSDTTAKARADAKSSSAQPSTSIPKVYAGDFTLRAEPLASWKPKILAIGSSTGGPQAIFALLKHLKNLPVPLVITQHMPATFTAILAQHIQSQTGISCTEADDGTLLQAGHAYLARGGKHMTFKKREDGAVIIKLNDGPPENFCKPAVDPMLRSIAEIYGGRSLCAILTGMGHDGLEGARQLVSQGGFVYAQDSASSVVWGMPGAVAKANICSGVLSIEDLGQKLKSLIT